MMLREAFGILALSEKDLDPRALEAVLTARLETAEFHDIPRLLEAYRTVNSLLETQMWYWNPETTSIHHQDGSTIELRGASPNVGVMTAPPPSSPPRVPPQKPSEPDEVELITDGVPPVALTPPIPTPPVPTPPATRAVTADDVSLVVDDETEALRSIPGAQSHPARSGRSLEPFEEPLHLSPSATARPPHDQLELPQPGFPASAATARAPRPEPVTQPRTKRAIPTLNNDDDLELAHTTMVIAPPRQKITAPWMVAVAAVGLAGGLWLLQSQTGRAVQRDAVVPVTNTQPQTSTPPAATITSPAANPTPSNPIPKPVIATAKPAPTSAAPKPGVSKPVTPKPVTPKPNVTARGAAKPSSPANLSAAVKPATQPTTPPPVTPTKPSTPAATPRPQPTVAKPQATPSFTTIRSPAPKPAAVPKAATTAQTRPPAKPVTKPAAKPVTATTVKPAQRPILPRPKPVSVPAPVAVIEAPKSTGLPDNLTREEYGRRYFNQKIFEVWQRSGAQLRYASWEAIPLEIQTLDSGRFRSAVYIAPPPEPPAEPK